MSNSNGVSGGDSESSMSDEDELGQSTEILLGYAVKEPTNDTVSHLGGEPVYPEDCLRSGKALG